MVYEKDASAPFMERDTHGAASSDTLVAYFDEPEKEEKEEGAALLATPQQSTTLKTKSKRRGRFDTASAGRHSIVALGGFLLAVLLLVGMEMSHPYAHKLTGRRVRVTSACLDQY